MKLSDQITRRHLFVAFGTSSQTGSLSSVDLAATRDDASVALTASDGSVAPIAGADAFAAGVMTAADKTRLDNLPPTTTRDFAIPATAPAPMTPPRSRMHWTMPRETAVPLRCRCCSRPEGGIASPT